MKGHHASGEKNVDGTPHVEKTTPVKEPKVKKEKSPSAPKISKIGSVGRTNVHYTLKKSWTPEEFTKFHPQQQAIIRSINTLTENGVKPTRFDVIKHIESTPELLSSMNTTQSISQCVRYHEKKMTKFLTTEEIKAETKVKSQKVKEELEAEMEKESA